jgi:hypothetical protein
LRIETLSQALWILGPLFLLSFAAGAVRVLAQREAPGRRRRLLQALWVLLLLAGVPLWLFAAATLRLI